MGPWPTAWGHSQQRAPVAPMTARAKTGPRGPGANLDHDYGRARARGSGDYKVCQLASWSQLQVWGKLADSVMWLGQVKNQRLMAGSVMWLGLAKVEGLTTDPETPRRMVARGRWNDALWFQFIWALCPHALKVSVVARGLGGQGTLKWIVSFRLKGAVVELNHWNTQVHVWSDVCMDCAKLEFSGARIQTELNSCVWFPMSTSELKCSTGVALCTPPLVSVQMSKFMHQASCMAACHCAWAWWWRVTTWLILPVVICLSQRLSHACLSISFYTAKLRMAH